MKNIIKSLLFSFLVLNISCENQKVGIDDSLLIEINQYISLNKENGTGIYWVEFNKENNSLIIFESSYYNKKDLDGYIVVEGNKVFFYYSNQEYVKINTLFKKGLKKTPDENSTISHIDFDSFVWEYSVNKDGSLTRVNKELK